jgi:hypothetical protein
MLNESLPFRKYRFRSVEEWKSALLTLPDNAYFDLLRSVFGNIKTPFNKHRLMGELASFLSRREIQETISAYINKNDHRVIAAIAILNEPVSGDLESFFAGEYSYVELHGLLLNLEERLILYRFREDGVHHLALNPLLEPVLAPFIANKSALFLPPYPGEKENNPEPEDAPLSGEEGCGPFLPDDRIIAALFAFVESQDEFFRNEGVLRKKVIEDGKQLFPFLDVETILKGLRGMGLFRVDGSRLRADRKKLSSFAQLSLRERLEYWAAGIYTASRFQDGEEFFFHRGRIQWLARFIRRFVSSLEEERGYSRRILARIVEVLGRENVPLRWAESGMPSFSIGEEGLDSFLEALKLTGLLREKGPDRYYSCDAISFSSREENSNAVIAMDSSFSCILYPGISFTDAVFLASFCAPREVGITVQFELTRESVVRGFDEGLQAETMLSRLEKLSGKPLDQNLSWTIKDWEERYSAVSLYQGTVLTLTENRRYLAETDPFSALIRKVLAPGVYLLSISDKEGVLQALRKAGVDIVAQPPLTAVSGEAEEEPASVRESRPGGAMPSPGSLRSPYPPIAVEPGGPIPKWFEPSPKEQFFCNDIRAVKADSAEYSGAAETCKERFRRALGNLRLPKQDTDELTARIERRVIVSESQLAPGVMRYEKLEARTLDFMGKTIVAKQAIANGSLVEVLLHEGGGESRILGAPQALEKSGGETVLVIRPVTPAGDSGAGSAGEAPESGRPEGPKVSGDIKLPLGKISLLRRIKQSIFEG